ncbi:MAG: hypothetical protein JWQ66_375 [Mucilaginibacter sp.]|nr:hypothetical protein [Mucilaginibacter sp.]
MVKIKEGCQMSTSQRAEYERMNAMPRKTAGKVDYFFKPQKKYPPRIYVFMHGEIWQDRNRRPMGLYGAFPFLSRPMNSEEIEYHHFDFRLCYHQYEDWDKLLYAEEQEAEQLDKEAPGTGTAFFKQLQSFREKYPLQGKLEKPTPIQPDVPISEEIRYFKELLGMADTLTVAEIRDLLDAEQAGEKRPLILTLLRTYYKDSASSDSKAMPDEVALQRKVFFSQERTRKNFIRRVHSRNPLFALEEIRERYPDYQAEQLAQDLYIKHKKSKAKKHKPILDLRRCQLEKLAERLQIGPISDQEYHTLCNRMVLLQHAHDLRLPIPLSVKLQGEIRVYDFNWKTREKVIKSFVDLANTAGMTHESLKKRYTEIIQSRNSF